MERSRDHAQEVREIVREHGAYLLRLLRYLGVSEADQQDVAQDIFITVHRRLPDFDGRAKVQTWLYAIATRTVANHRRKKARARVEFRSEVPELTSDPKQEQGLRRQEARKRLLALLQGLTPEKREVFVLHEIEEIPIPEIARVLEIAEGTAYSRLRAARMEMQRRGSRPEGGAQ